MGCTKPQWCRWSTLALLLTIAASLWLTLAFYFYINVDVRCVLSGLADLAAITVPSGSGFDAGQVQDSIASIPQEILNILDQYSRFAAVITALPGFLAVVFLLIAMCSVNKNAKCCTKTAIVFFDIFAILQFCVCLFAGGAGIVTTQPSVTAITGDFQAQFTSTCAAEIELLRNTTQAATGEDRTLAENTLNTVEGLCDCLGRIIEDVQTLIPSGFAGAAMMLLAFIAAQYACCITTEGRGASVGATEKAVVQMKKRNQAGAASASQYGQAEMQMVQP